MEIDDSFAFSKWSLIVTETPILEFVAHGVVLVLASFSLHVFGWFSRLDLFLLTLLLRF